MNLEEKMKQDLCRELIIPEVVDEKLSEAYRHILSMQQKDVNRKNAVRITPRKQNKNRANRHVTAWIGATAAALAVVITAGVLFSQPALARSLPIIGNLFAKIEATNSRTDPKDKTAYEQIEKYSKNLTEQEKNAGESFEKAERNPDGTSTEPGYIADDSGVEVLVSDVYFDGYDLYYTLSIRTEDAELNSSEFLTPLNFVEGDSLPFFASAFLNGTEVTSVFMQPRKSEDGSFVQLVRISMDATGITSTDPLDIRLNFNAIGGTRLEDIGTYDGAYREAMGHKTIRGNWKLAFQASADPSGSRSLTSPAENQGFTVMKATATPSNLHLTVRIPFGWDTNALVPQIYDSNGGEVEWEHISYMSDPATGQPLLEITANAAEASQFVMKIIDKTTSSDDMLNVIAEIPFELQ